MFGLKFSVLLLRLLKVTYHLSTDRCCFADFALGLAVLILLCISSNSFATVCFSLALLGVSLLGTQQGRAPVRMAWQLKWQSVNQNGFLQAISGFSNEITENNTHLSLIFTVFVFEKINTNQNKWNFVLNTMEKLLKRPKDHDQPQNLSTETSTNEQNLPTSISIAH